MRGEGGREADIIDDVKAVQTMIRFRVEEAVS